MTQVMGLTSLETWWRSVKVVFLLTALLNKRVDVVTVCLNESARLLPLCGLFSQRCVVLGSEMNQNPGFL